MDSVLTLRVSMLELSIRSNIEAVSRKLSALAYRQLPFAEARTVTELAKLAADAERNALPQVFDNPTPFTVNSVAVQPARKGTPVARVYIRDKAARYLAPYEFGGVQYLGAKPANLVPAGASANQYGNLPRNAIRKYMGRLDVFMGSVRTKRRTAYGVWQRPAPAQSTSPRRRGKDRAANTTGSLRLLVAFHAPVETKKRLEFGKRAEALVSANFDRVFGRELARAIANAT
ncbi:hypothetical protein HDG34_005643 [Paraburkholderia sp. HC6.4b]|uniref:hypothetical protein n=1 Tax=unclassified Paraburkholderia TaxID=2615204 RepID=UPI0016176AD6|nr:MULTISPECIES: hypothetical protein [unclassified Paraburkholderia]MBB5411682.1 hypothetical protein [Paraburkholderia sp. HC6.4b]MBB5453289.1 hypothetical protein [Paraburkholderia sp. Kb1A]